LGLKVQGLKFRVWGLGFRVWGSGVAHKVDGRHLEVLVEADEAGGLERPLEEVRQREPVPAERQVCSGSEAGSYVRLIDFCITQLKVQGPSSTWNESKEEERREKRVRTGYSRADSYPWSPFPPRRARPEPGPHTKCGKVHSRVENA